MLVGCFCSHCFFEIGRRKLESSGALVIHPHFNVSMDVLNGHSLQMPGEGRDVPVEQGR